MRAAMLLRNKDVLGGALVCALGGTAIASVRSFGIGTLGRMGPGFFPILVGVVMILAGLAILAGGLRALGSAGQITTPDLRAWVMVPLSLIAFIVLGEYGGLLPATFAVVFVAALADRDNTWRSALAIAAAMAVVGIVVFWWALQVQFPLLTFGIDR